MGGRTALVGDVVCIVKQFVTRDLKRDSWRWISQEADRLTSRLLGTDAIYTVSIGIPGATRASYECDMHWQSIRRKRNVKKKKDRYKEEIRRYEKKPMSLASCRQIRLSDVANALQSSLAEGLFASTNEAAGIRDGRVLVRRAIGGGKCNWSHLGGNY